MQYNIIVIMPQVLSVESRYLFSLGLVTESQQQNAHQKLINLVISKFLRFFMMIIFGTYQQSSLVG